MQKVHVPPMPPRFDIQWFIGPDSEWFWAMLQFLLLAVSLWFIYRQIRIQSHANMLTATFELARVWDGSNMAEARHHVCDKYVNSVSVECLPLSEERIASFFELLGVFLYKNAFTEDVVWEEYSYYIEHYWPILRGRIEDLQQVEKDKSYFNNFQDLYDRMLRINKRKKLHGFARTEEELKKFAIGELSTALYRRRRDETAVETTQGTSSTKQSSVLSFRSEGGAPHNPGPEAET